jgi:hypothetical protein
MAVARGFIGKTELSPEDKLRVAIGYLMCGFSQHGLAAMFAVNQGRIHKAIQDVAKAVEWPGRVEVEPEPDLLEGTE